MDRNPVQLDGHPQPPATTNNDLSLLASFHDLDGDAASAPDPADPLLTRTTTPPPLDNSATTQQPLRDNCDRRRPQEVDNTRLKKMPSELVGKTVSPFLKEHIPGLYAPVGKGNKDDASDPTAIRKKDPNTRYCYRHRPDSKCRRAADETKMGFIQSVRRGPP